MQDAELQKIMDRLIRLYKPEKVILFGSTVSGRNHKWSDIDLVAIKDTDKRFYDRIGEVSALIPHNLPIDILVYTPAEFEIMLKENYFIQNEVIKKGKVVYEQSS